MKLDGISRTLGHAGPAFNTILLVEGIGFIVFDLIDFARAYLSAVSTTITFFLVNDRIHYNSKSQIPNPKP
jgi:hypothetical protein